MVKGTIKSIDKKKSEDNASVFNMYHVISVAIITAIVSLFMGMQLNKSNTNIKYSSEIDNFVQEYLKIKNEYYKEIDDSEAMKIALEAVLNNLDDYSAVVDDSLSNTLTTKLQGSYEGFGIEIYNDQNYNIIVASVIEDTPAFKAGIKVFDVIKKIDEKDISGMTTLDFISFIKNSKKNSFNITVERDGVLKELFLERKMITLKSVSGKVFERNNKKIGYLLVDVFAFNTDIQFSQELKKIEKENIDSLIVDLRDNTGGHLGAVQNMLSEFLKKNQVIYQMQTRDKIEKFYSTNNSSRDLDVAILVNENSASASELFAAGMQEQYKAKIIGTRTYGKGTVQEVLNTDESDIEYKITTKKWLTPNGTWIEGVGVKPDINVELKVRDINSYTELEDNQLQTAIDYLAK